MPDYCLHTSVRQEQFCIAWIHSLAAASGYSLEKVPVDVDSVDVSVKQRSNGMDAPEIDRLDVQLKCTFAHAPNEEIFPFPLRIKNYNDLRHPRLTIPRILVVLHVPAEPATWIDFDPESLTLRNCAYWASLRHMPETDNEETVTVHIPTNQRLNVESLTALMTGLAVGELPNSLGAEILEEPEVVDVENEEKMVVDEPVNEIEVNGNGQ